MGQLAVAAARAGRVRLAKPESLPAIAQEIAGLAQRQATGVRVHQSLRSIPQAPLEQRVQLAAQGVTAEPALAATPGRLLSGPKLHCTRTRSAYRRQLAPQEPAQLAPLPVVVERNST